MLKSLPVSLRAAVFALLAVAFHACTPHQEELPTPTASPALTVRDAQNWYQSTYPTAALLSGPQINTASANAAAEHSNSTLPVLVWAHALTLGQGNQQMVFVPLAGDRALFAARRWQGTRYLIVTRNAAQALNGNVVELLLRRTSTPVDTMALFSGLYRGLMSGQPVAPAQGEGLVMLYSADYRYLTGRQFRNGQLLPGASRLVFLPYRGDEGTNKGPARGTPTQSRATSSGACTDWYSSTGAYITTTGNCTFYVDNGSYDPSLIDYGNSGNPADIMLNGPGGYGGYLSGGGTEAASVATIIPILLPCVSPSLSSLQNLNGNDIGGLFRYFSTTPYSTWVIQSGNIPNDSDGRQRNALTSQSNGMPADYIVTTINNSFANTATDVAISRTLIHESMHAYLMLWTYSRGMNVNVTTSQLVDGYLGTLNPNDPSGQHDAMVAIINQMAGALQMRFPTLPLEYAKNLFWAGLTETREYAALSAAQKAAITAAATAELLSQAAALGTKACN